MINKVACGLCATPSTLYHHRRCTEFGSVRIPGQELPPNHDGHDLLSSGGSREKEENHQATDIAHRWGDIHPTTSAIPSATPTSVPTFGHHGIPRAQGAGLSLCPVGWYPLVTFSCWCSSPRPFTEGKFEQPSLETCGVSCR